MAQVDGGGQSDARTSLLQATGGETGHINYSSLDASGRAFSSSFGRRGGHRRSLLRRLFGTVRNDGEATDVKESKGEGPPAKSPANRHAAKLGTFTGVFVPTVLNVLSILMFIRFGFIVGQAGFVGTVAHPSFWLFYIAALTSTGLLVACYVVTIFTTMSVSAIASNGTVRGGGPYYLISRSLGPEFGGSIGIVLYLGYVFNTGMNAVGLIDSFVQNFGKSGGTSSNWLPDSYWQRYAWSSVTLLVCTLICLAGSGIFTRASNLLLVILLSAIASIPISTLFVNPFTQTKLGVHYTGPSLTTFRENLMPDFTRGAAGSHVKGRENFQDVFGILFPATAGIFAGASMSGSLKNPSRAIPRGTMSGLALTFVAYIVVIISLSASVERSTFRRDINVVQDINGVGELILLGEFAASFFSVLMGELGASVILQAIARDDLLPGLRFFGYGTKANDDPLLAILVTYGLSQLTLFADINQIASLVTMAYLMTFLVVNLACFLLKVSSAPNFRPSFHYFRWWTAAGGGLLSLATMFFVDGVYASACLGILIILFILIHFTTKPKAWGDVSQGLIYHQVRKYLLRLRQDHVKFWRPQILLFVNDPRRSYKLIQFCNSLKKGALFILGHVIVTSDFPGSVEEARKQQQNWKSYIDFSRIKAFINVAISPALEWGSRNIILSSGLGSMRPNIVIMGFYNLSEYRISHSLSSLPPSRPSTPRPAKRNRPGREDERFQGDLPTDSNRPESAVGPMDYMTVLEDMLLRLRTNVAIAYNFQELDLPPSHGSSMGGMLSSLAFWNSKNFEESPKQYIDLWPIQMSAEIQGDDNVSYQTSNFDTYALILQLGCILHTVPSWKECFRLRVIVFVEYESDVAEERGRVRDLLTNLRIEADVKVVWLASGKLKTYEILINGADQGPGIEQAMEEVDAALKDEDWWTETKDVRDASSQATGFSIPRANTDLSEGYTTASVTASGVDPTGQLGKALLKGGPRRRSIGNLSQFGLNFTMQTQRLDPQIVQNLADGFIESSSSESSDTESLADEIIQQPYSSARVVGQRENLGALDVEEDEFGHLEIPPSDFSNARSSLLDGLRSPPSERNQDRPSQLSPTIGEEDKEDSFVEDPKLSLVRTRSESPKHSEHVSKPTRKPLPKRPTAIRGYSMPRLSSSLVPQTEVTSEEGPGPSIMFRMPSPPTRPGRAAQRSIYDPPQEGEPLHRRRTGSEASRHTSTSRETYGSNASGFPSLQSQAVSFNTLPSRAQYLILNELMQRHSGGADTGVVFTTLPAPAPDTCESKDDSLRYLADLETLCHDLPPCLLVHSNSCTVTMNL